MKYKEVTEESELFKSTLSNKERQSQNKLIQKSYQLCPL